MDKLNQGKKAVFITQAAVIAALYTVLVIIFNYCSFGPIQFRIAEALTILPNIISHIAAPPKMLDNRQPTNSPGIAAGVKYGRIVSASAILNCIGPKLQ